MKSRSYWKSIAPWKSVLRDALDHQELKALHARQPSRHLAYAGRQFAIIAVCSVALWHLDDPVLFLPFAILQGFTFFNMTTLLHEVVHSLVFKTRRVRAERLLGLLYASTSGISATQFTRWHLDHHDNLGDEDDDPKRHWLSPKRNARWWKLLYCTPALILIYFRAAAAESRSYPRDLRLTIARERLFTVSLQLTVAAVLLLSGGVAVLLRVWAIPYFLVFPVAFTLNRLGQHYAIDPSRPIAWATVMRANRIADFLYLSSNYHAEHHFFPGVPFYNLRKLHLALLPLYDRLAIPRRTYRWLAWNWFVLNRKPHTAWDTLVPPEASPQAGSVSTRA